ncbi:MAG: hypothetical protein JO319_07190 [Acidobacteriaceae bacterium]|nr:hypothetical protein [Acidobacteriaceae bacterium]
MLRPGTQAASNFIVKCGVPTFCAVLAIWPALPPTAARADIPDAKSALWAGYENMYNLQFATAHKVFDEYRQQHPNDPMGPVSNAAAYLFFEFDRLKILRSDFFTQDRKFFGGGKLQPDPKVRKAFDADLDKARQLVDARLKSKPDDHDALLARVIATALDADYKALIEKQYWQALNEIKQSQAEAENLLKVCSDCYDAYLAKGVENYLLSQKPAAERWLLRLTGAQTDKQIGIDDLRIVAEKGHYLKPYAKILLAIAALRDNNKQTAKELLEDLAHNFPQNDLFRDELTRLSSSCCG